MQYLYLVTLAALAPSVLAAPAGLAVTARSAPLNSVKVLTQVITGPSLAGLAHEPSDFATENKAFLQKYQLYANSAANEIGAKQSDLFASSGWCFEESPCFSVDRLSTVDIPMSSGQAIAPLNISQVEALLDTILAQAQTTLGNSNHDTPFNGLKSTVDGATLEIIAPSGTVSSAFIAGMVFDTYKASINSGGNAVRAVQAQQDGGAPPTIAICLYPEVVDITSSGNFCIGKELDGSLAPTTTAATKRDLATRFSLDGLLTGFCAIIDIPLLCPAE